MHRLLKRQLNRHLGKDFDVSTLPENISNFIEDVSKSYDELYDEKKFLEHTIHINSEDLHKASVKIKEQNTKLQKLLEQTSDENEEMVHLLKQYKEVIDKSLIVSITDTKGKIKYVNKNFCKISGYSEKELIGKAHSLIRHPDVKKELFKDMWNTILSKKIWQGIFPNLAKDGSTYYVNATIIPLLNINGDIIEFMALREDVTKTMDYQKKLESEKHRVSEILDNQESIIVLFTKGDGVTEVNRKFLEIFDFDSLDSFKQKHQCVCELFEEKENFLKQSTSEHYWFEPILEKPEHVHLAMIDKKIYSVKISILEIDIKENYLATFTDITEIEEARVKSEEAEREKANFLANMSHEIRTPMNAVLGFSELLAKTKLDQKQTKFVDLIKSSSSTLIKIINDILDFSKLENGQTETTIIKINPFMEFEETFMLLSQRAHEKNINYKVYIDPTIEECIEIDSFHIKQILMNLIGNAIKFTSENGKIDIKIEKTTDTQNQIRFSVEDSGIGIPEDRQKKIFEPFSQADSSTTREFGGTGLGLSISNSIVTMLGSELKLESKIGIGSKFYFDINYVYCKTKNTLKDHLEPFNLYICDTDHSAINNISDHLKAYDIKYNVLSNMEKGIDVDRSIIISTNENKTKNLKRAKVLLFTHSDEKDNSNRYHSIEFFNEFPSILYNELMRLELIKPDIDTANTRDINLKILVAEDYDINRILISELLDQFNISYEFALNGQEAVDLIKQNSYDLVLMDINMPVMNGMDATKIIINELKIDTPIIALTANALKGDREKFLAVGMSDYLTKPIDIKAFEEILLKYDKIEPSKSIKEQLDDEVEIDLNIEESLVLASKQLNLPDRIIDKIFRSFLDSIDEFETNIKEAIESNDYEKIQFNAHNLKSGAATFSFHNLTKLSQELESNSKEKNELFDYKSTFNKMEVYLKLLNDYKLTL